MLAATHAFVTACRSGAVTEPPAPCPSTSAPRGSPAASWRWARASPAGVSMSLGVAEGPDDVRQVHPDGERHDQPDVDEPDRQPRALGDGVVGLVALLAVLALLPPPVGLHRAEDRDQDQNRVRP